MSGSTGTESFVQLPPNGTGTVVDGFTVDPPGTLPPAFRQAVVIGDSADSDNVAAVDDQNRLTVHNADLGLLDMIAEDIAQADGNGPGLLKPPFTPADGSEPSIMVQISPNSPLLFDQTVPAMVGGVGPDGANRRMRIGADGGLQLSDAIGQTVVLPSSGTVCLLDTTGYQSICLQLAGTWTGGVTFTVSNDLQNWTAANVTTASAPGVVGSSAVTNGIVLASVQGRYFRAVFSWSTGTLIAVPMLRAAAVPIQTGAVINSISSFNLGQINGTTPVTANVTGMLAVGGNIASGSAPTAYPVLAGGSDYSGLTRRLQTDGNGNLIAVGILFPGYQWGAYNVTYTKYTTAYGPTLSASQSIVAPVMTGGLDQSCAARPILTDSAGALQVGSRTSTPADQSITELLLQLVALGRVQAQYLYEIRTAAIGSLLPDEPDALLADFLNPATSLSNMIN
jgi:hypothetical protein